MKKKMRGGGFLDTLFGISQGNGDKNKVPPPVVPDKDKKPSFWESLFGKKPTEPVATNTANPIAAPVPPVIQQHPENYPKSDEHPPAPAPTGGYRGAGGKTKKNRKNRANREKKNKSTRRK